MNAGQLILIFGDVVRLLELRNVLLADGTFDKKKLDTIQEDVEFATSIEDILKQHGLNIPDKVDKVIKILPLVIDFIS